MWVYLASYYSFLSCLFSRLSECVSLHWPSFRSYWEMAATLKFNQLSHHSDKKWRERAEIAREKYKDIQACILPQLCTQTTALNAWTLIWRRESDVIAVDVPRWWRVKATTDCMLKSTSERAIEYAISLEAEKETMCTLWPLAFWFSSCFQLAVLVYHIIIKRNVFVFLLSSLNLSLNIF